MEKDRERQRETEKNRETEKDKDKKRQREREKEAEGLIEGRNGKVGQGNEFDGLESGPHALAPRREVVSTMNYLSCQRLSLPTPSLQSLYLCT